MWNICKFVIVRMIIFLIAWTLARPTKVIIKASYSWYTDLVDTIIGGLRSVPHAIEVSIVNAIMPLLGVFAQNSRPDAVAAEEFIQSSLVYIYTAILFGLYEWWLYRRARR